jgi:hypothetical protein
MAGFLKWAVAAPALVGVAVAFAAGYGGAADWSIALILAVGLAALAKAARVFAAASDRRAREQQLMLAIEEANRRRQEVARWRRFDKAA